ESLFNYKIIKKFEFTYRSMSDDQTFVFNMLEITDIGLVSPAYYVFKTRNVSCIFFKYLLNNSNYLKFQIYRVIEGTTRTALKLNRLLKFTIMLPPIPEQERIATVLSQIDEVIEKEKAYKEKLEGIKKGLMEDLLTGKVRVNHLIEEESKDEIGRGALC
ncbi:restriction endonuclease subunit S, partial [Caldisericum sp.]|uniref:restriction endonuclease subunit S n=1 Tax=Caldisericum sp. TaxID=2499687 RepID=UPI003D1320A3